MSGVQAKQTGKATVVVGCKLPNGMFLHIDRPVEEKGPDGHVFNIKHVLHGERVLLNGSNSSRVVGGYGLTRGVDQSFWDEWMKQNATSKLVVNGLVFAQSSTDKATDQAEEQNSVRSKLEPLDPDKPAKNLAKLEDK